MTAIESTARGRVGGGLIPVGQHRRLIVAGLIAGLVAFLMMVRSSASFDAGRPDFFYLADAFLHGRLWLDHAFGPYDNVILDGRVYVPFAPFPGILLTPLVAVVGPAVGDQWEQVVDSAFAAICVLLCWWLLSRQGVGRIIDRIWIVVLLCFSTPVWWVTTRGGVWHTGQLIATMLTLLALIEARGRRRPFLLGLLVGMDFLTRAPLALAAPYFAWLIAEGSGSRLDPRTWPIAAWSAYGLGILPAVAFSFWYNEARFGSVFESGYGLASLPAFLEQSRELGLFSLNHLGMNFDYLFLHLPKFKTQPPFMTPDGLGMSIFLTSPGLLVALRANWRSKEVVALGLAALAILIPSLLYYGGGWYQFGYRYALDSIPFVVAIVGLAVARHGVPGWGKLLILAGLAVNTAGIYWNYHP